MTYLVDANVLSEATKPDPDPRVISWLRKNEANIVVDLFILGEIQFGILQLPRGNRRKRLERWFEQGVRRAQCLVGCAVRTQMGASSRRPAKARRGHVHQGQLDRNDSASLPLHCRDSKPTRLQKSRRQAYQSFRLTLQA